jgi:hypothetical protein
MTSPSPTLAQTLDTLRATDRIRSVTVSEDGERVTVACGCVYEDAEHPEDGFTADSYEAWATTERLLRAHGLRHSDSAVDEAASDRFDAIELWVFTPAA